jgi:hypothetical protein
VRADDGTPKPGRKTGAETRPDPDDPFGLSNLSIDENELFDRLLKASIQSGDAVDVTDLDPLMAEKFSVIISRALRWQEEVAR